MQSNSNQISWGYQYTPTKEIKLTTWPWWNAHYGDESYGSWCTRQPNCTPTKTTARQRSTSADRCKIHVHLKPGSPPRTHRHLACGYSICWNLGPKGGRSASQSRKFELLEGNKSSLDWKRSLWWWSSSCWPWWWWNFLADLLCNLGTCFLDLSEPCLGISNLLGNLALVKLWEP